MKSLKIFLEQTIYLLSYLLMTVSFLAVIFRWFNLPWDWVLWGNIGGYSLITSVLFFKVFYFGKYCWTTKHMPIALIITNIINIWGLFYPKYYFWWYEVFIFSVFLFMSIIIWINKRINR